MLVSEKEFTAHPNNLSYFFKKKKKQNISDILVVSTHSISFFFFLNLALCLHGGSIDKFWTAENGSLLVLKCVEAIKAESASSDGIFSF